MQSMRLTSPRAALDAAVYGRRFTAFEAKESGIVELTTSAGQLIDESRKLVRQLVPESGIDRDSLSNMKQDFFQDILKMIKESQPSRKDNFAKPKL